MNLWFYNHYYISLIIHTFYRYFHHMKASTYLSTVEMALRLREVLVLTVVLVRNFPTGFLYPLWCSTSGPFNQPGRFGSVRYLGKLDGDTSECWRDGGFKREAEA